MKLLVTGNIGYITAEFIEEAFIFLIILHFMGRWRVRLRLYTSYYITIRGI